MIIRILVGIALFAAVMLALSGCTINLVHQAARPPMMPPPQGPNLLKNPCANMACNDTRRIA
jgi:hypothetical protein